LILGAFWVHPGFILGRKTARKRGEYLEFNSQTNNPIPNDEICTKVSGPFHQLHPRYLRFFCFAHSDRKKVKKRKKVWQNVAKCGIAAGHQSEPNGLAY
jgi:hypothetical protein